MKKKNLFLLLKFFRNSRCAVFTTTEKLENVLHPFIFLLRCRRPIGKMIRLSIRLTKVRAKNDLKVLYLYVAGGPFTRSPTEIEKKK